MTFNSLDDETKIKLHEDLLSFANNIGGINFFLGLIEDIKKENNHPLLNKSGAFHYTNGRVSWGKQIYRDTFTLLQESLKREESEGNMLAGLDAKTQKQTINMMKALKPIEIKVSPKNRKDGEGFSFKIFEVENDVYKTSLVYKTIFFYNISFAKEALNYQI